MGATSTITPTLLAFFLVSNLTGVSLASGGIRKSIGALSIPVGAIAGQYIGFINIDFEVPEYSESGRFVDIALRMPVGTATASQIIRGSVLVKGVTY